MAHTSVFNEISDLLQATADETAAHCVHAIATWLDAKGQPQLAADLIAEFTHPNDDGTAAIAKDGDAGYLTIENGDAAGRADLDAKGVGLPMAKVNRALSLVGWGAIWTVALALAWLPFVWPFVQLWLALTAH